MSKWLLRTVGRSPPSPGSQLRGRIMEDFLRRAQLLLPLCIFVFYFLFSSLSNCWLVLSVLVVLLVLLVLGKLNIIQLSAARSIFSSITDFCSVNDKDHFFVEGLRTEGCPSCRPGGVGVR